jgi:SiaC family regulatory phosphoprotein
MIKINLEGTEDTPKIILDPENKIYEISGRSLPEDCAQFYKPILDWLDAYNGTGKMDFEIKLDYFNTASSKLILDILNRIEKLKDKGHDVKISWYHQEDDEDMQEAGEEFSELVEVEFEIKAY